MSLAIHRRLRQRYPACRPHALCFGSPVLRPAVDSPPMPLTWANIKRLSRLQGVASELADSLQRFEETSERRPVEELLENVAREVHAILTDSDLAMAEEFQRVVMDSRQGRLKAAPYAAVMAGWLKGAVEAETLEVRLRLGEERSRI